MNGLYEYEVKLKVSHWTNHGKNRPIVTYNIRARNETQASDRGINSAYESGYDMDKVDLISVKKL